MEVWKEINRIKNTFIEPKNPMIQNKWTETFLAKLSPPWVSTNYDTNDLIGGNDVISTDNVNNIILTNTLIL